MDCGLAKFRKKVEPSEIGLEFFPNRLLCAFLSFENLVKCVLNTSYFFCYLP
ncbi:hypothetical protein Halhy_0555 [Haliscomenobacter hydrossis DSM 1100]|uniref:Uncharacterized protein n=1 Tax=Haliscomenobacter hydrossis (strain ATCC 27775 / DSM 1100 / LMG 10767 / O) TaxID=760192 RepID=F4L0F3_HALH1|nr:hypothetical protein Halhy_0555 [Haliscomenobacter hydrossis DSM 1100]